jgi:hypothetical protein
VSCFFALNLKNMLHMRIAVLGACLAVCFSPVWADSIVAELGVAGPEYYGIVTNSAAPHMNGPGTSNGNVAVLNSGASLQLAGSAGPSISGNVYLANGASVQPATGQVTGSTLSLPNANVIASTAASAAGYFGNLAPTNSISSITSTEAITSSGSGATNVLDISNFKLGNQQVLTLSGGAHDQFVFNITGGLTLNSGEIQLAGGLLPTDVVFNIESGDLQTSGGDGCVEDDFARAFGGRTKAPALEDAAIFQGQDCGIHGVRFIVSLRCLPFHDRNYAAGGKIG